MRVSHLSGAVEANRGVDRVYQAITVGDAFAKMRTDAARLGAEYRIGWTSRDTVFPTPAGLLWLTTAAGFAAFAVAVWPPALAASGLALLLGILRIRECNVTVTYIRNDGPAMRVRAPGG
jgi:hypothetical protein